MRRVYWKMGRTGRKLSARVAAGEPFRGLAPLLRIQSACTSPTSPAVLLENKGRRSAEIGQAIISRDYSKGFFLDASLTAITMFDADFSSVPASITTKAAFYQHVLSNLKALLEGSETQLDETSLQKQKQNWVALRPPQVCSRTEPCSLKRGFGLI